MPKSSAAPRLAGYSALVLLLNTICCGAANFPAPSGKFTFEGKPYVGTPIITNAVITNNSLFFPGKYNWLPDLFWPLVFNYQQFSIVVKLRPENISYATLLVGGTGHRWLVVNTDKDGRVKLSFNNHQFRHAVDSLIITNGQWTTLALTFDLQARKTVVYANGKQAEAIVLPEAFVLDVMNDEKWRESDKVLTFTDGATGGTFRGLVAGLLTFNSVLSPNQVRLLFPNK